MHSLVATFTVVLEIWTQIVILVLQGLHQLCYLSSPMLPSNKKDQQVESCECIMRGMKGALVYYFQHSGQAMLTNFNNTVLQRSTVPIIHLYIAQ